MLMFILLVQVAVAVYAFVVIKQVDPDTVRKGYNELFQTYPTEIQNREIVDVIQSSVSTWWFIH